ncbi:unnamed protein product [Darwinula stevensoni]|uniref:K Homology domain-containing protein n=1 Tax=Darwinula stevensoni TaxID=69355 RepID=A0A7R8XAV8_9CRUS|nr:unnamed protein product [Darwinula stevensoni]CAG0892292.1 unnamed protein product [Darwinula stevensoni]
MDDSKWNTGSDDGLGPKDSFDDDVNNGINFWLEAGEPAGFAVSEEPESGREKAEKKRKQRGRRGGRKGGASQPNHQRGKPSIEHSNADQSGIPYSTVMTNYVYGCHWIYDMDAEEIKKKIMKLLRESTSGKVHTSRLGHPAMMPVGDVLELLKGHDLFSISEEGVISLTLEVCDAHLSIEGCEKENCKSLHVCTKYVCGRCPRVKCDEGHDFKTGHNRRVLRKFGLEDEDEMGLRKFIQLPSFVPEICFGYNLEGCKKESDCQRLHICVCHIMEKCDDAQCSLNHDVLDDRCLGVLKKFKSYSEKTRKEWKTYLRDEWEKSGKANMVHEKRRQRHEGKQKKSSSKQMKSRPQEGHHLPCKRVNNIVTDKVPVPPEFRGHMIGVKGKVVNEFMEAYGVKIHVPSFQDSSNDIIVTGPLTNVEQARKAVEEKIQQLKSQREDRRARSFEGRLKVPARFHGKLIGKGGETVNKLTQDHQVKINFPKENTGGPPDEIIIIGYRNRVLEAERAIRELVPWPLPRLQEESQQQDTHAPTSYSPFSVPQPNVVASVRVAPSVPAPSSSFLSSTARTYPSAAATPVTQTTWTSSPQSNQQPSSIAGSTIPNDNYKQSSKGGKHNSTCVLL